MSDMLAQTIQDARPHGASPDGHCSVNMRQTVDGISAYIGSAYLDGQIFAIAVTYDGAQDLLSQGSSRNSDATKAVLQVGDDEQFSADQISTHDQPLVQSLLFTHPRPVNPDGADVHLTMTVFLSRASDNEALGPFEFAFTYHADERNQSKRCEPMG